MTITVHGKKWKISGAVCTMLIHNYDDPKAYSPKFILGCTRCETFCVEGALCKCCLQPKNQRPYDEGHDRLIETAVFVSRLKARAA